MRRLYLALILLFAYSGHSYASCKRSGNEGAITITPPSQLVVDSHAYTAGEVLWQSGWVSTSEVTMDGCSRDYKVGFLYEPGSAQSIHQRQSMRMTGTTRRYLAPGFPAWALRLKPKRMLALTIMSCQSIIPTMNGDGNKTHHAMAPAYNVELVALGVRSPPVPRHSKAPLARVSFRDSATEDSGGDILTHLYLGNTQLIMNSDGMSGRNTCHHRGFRQRQFRQFR
ncbi:fimbrial protein [Salmonella enterica subsp. enterica serovar Typhimurium]|nr:fimbrial protein [Salmonella enterica subsp. enterica serovar Typhimurium]